MAVAFRSAGGLRGGGTAYYPVGAQQDDVLILAALPGTFSSDSTGATWTLLETASGGNQTMRVYWRRWTSGTASTGNENVTLSGGGAGVAQIFAFSGVRTTSTPYTAVAEGGSNSVSATSAGLSGWDTANPFLVAVLGYGGATVNRNISFTGISGGSAVQLGATSNTSGQGRYINAAYYDGTSGSSPATATGSWGTTADGAIILFDFTEPVAVKQGSASGSFTFTGSSTGEAPVPPPNEGSASGSWTAAGAATGARTSTGSASGSTSFAGAATGATTHSGAAATGTVDWSGTATAARPSAGSAAGGFAVTGSASGSAPALDQKSGSASGAYAVAGSATGEAPGVDASSGSASGSYHFGVTGTVGRAPNTGFATQDMYYNFAGSASGARTSAGSASATVAFAGSGTGLTSRSGASAGSYGFAGTAQGSEPFLDPGLGSASSAWAFSGEGQGERESRGAGAGAGAWACTVSEASGERESRGSATAAWAFVGETRGLSDPRDIGLLGELEDDRLRAVLVRDRLTTETDESDRIMATIEAGRVSGELRPHPVEARIETKVMV